MTAITGHITVGAAENLAGPGGFVSAGAIVDRRRGSRLRPA
ncbi:MAG TPA: hypothetical protein VG294_07655 [Solirubrobacteraceae bacterium]|nr:hypothetical protein [Solirubrobacteraceae bacterium]